MAKWQEEVVAAAVLLEQGSKFELKNIAVAKDWQGNGIANQSFGSLEVAQQRYG